jgi:hypothetical protein
MKVFFTDSFNGLWPVGAARFICVAPNMDAAKAMLHKEMYDSGLKAQYVKAAEGLEEISTDSARVIDFGDGNY